MDNLLSGALGGLIGTIISSVISYFIFSKQMRIDSNRHILEAMYERIRKIYSLIQLSREIDEDDLNFLISFKVIGLKEFEKLNTDLINVQKALIGYNEGVKKSLSATTTSSVQVTYKNEVERSIDNLVITMRGMS